MTVYCPDAVAHGACACVSLSCRIGTSEFVYLPSVYIIIVSVNANNSMTSAGPRQSTVLAPYCTAHDNNIMIIRSARVEYVSTNFFFFFS